MNISNRILSKSSAVVFTALFAASFAASASGNHAGGHDVSPIGQPGVAAKVNRTVAVGMSDTMTYTPSDIQVKKGETIRSKCSRSSFSVPRLISCGTLPELVTTKRMVSPFFT